MELGGELRLPCVSWRDGCSKRYRGHVARGVGGRAADRVDVHVALLELPREDSHAVERLPPIEFQGFAEVDLVVLVVPDYLVVVAVAPVEHEVRVALELFLLMRKDPREYQRVCQ